MPRSWVFAAALLLASGLCPFGPGARAQCDARSVSQDERDLASLTSAIDLFQSNIDSLRHELSALGARADELRPRADSDRGARRELDGVLRDSREVSTRLDAEAAQQRGVVSRGAPIAASLRSCYVAELNNVAARLDTLFSSGQLDQARPMIVRASELELKIENIDARYGDASSDASYPRLSEDFIRSSLTSVEQRSLVLDSMRDLMDGAQRDSVTAHERIQETTQRLQLKSDLLALLNRRRDSGIGNGGFFDEFRGDELEVEIQELRAAQARWTAALRDATVAMAYYRDRVKLLEALTSRE